MSTISVYLCGSLCLVCAVVSLGIRELCAVLIRRSQFVAEPTQKEHRRDAEVAPIRHLIDSVERLTIRMDEQVGAHSTRVSLINDSLVTADAEPSFLVGAGLKLLEANQQLQAELASAQSEIERQRTQMSGYIAESLTDPLTSLSNRRAWDKEFDRIFTRWQCSGRIFTVMLIDIDHFKKVNDTHGHLVGDQLLKGFSRELKESLRENDFLARFGGEEFVVAMRGTTLSEGLQAAELIRVLIQSKAYSLASVPFTVTVSIGIKEVQKSETAEALLRNVDAALYAAKSNGRNCCYYHDGLECRPAPGRATSA